MKKMYFFTLTVILFITIIFLIFYHDDNSLATDFLKSYGYETSPEYESSVFIVPDSFDKTMQGYNLLQLSQGYSFDAYKGRRVRKYTYKITNSDFLLYSNIFIYRGKIIAADLTNPELSGFLLPIVHISELTKYQIPEATDAAIP